MKKNFTLKSVFTLIAAFALAMPAWADVTSVADLFGKYKFTADVETLDNSYAGKFSGDCEVTIGKDQYNIYDGVINGLAGLSGRIVINKIDTENNAICIYSPNTGLGAEGLYMSDITGSMNIFTGDSTQYGDINYTYDPATKNFTLPDFSLVTKDGSQKVDAIVAKFTNAKLTLLEAEAIEVADLSGKWHYTAGKGDYDTMEGSTLPLEWDMTLTATNESNSTYDVSLALGDFAPLALTASFDGVKLTIPYDSVFFDATNRISLWDSNGGRYKGNVEFNIVSENSLTLTKMEVRQDSISPEIDNKLLQWYMNGLAKRQGAEEATTTWDGTYKVKGTLAHVAIKDYDYPTEFDVKVVYNEAADMYFITEFMGNDVTALNYGGIRLTPSADDPNKAEIATGKYLQTIIASESYLCLKDMNLGDSPLTLTRKEDGTYEISDFSVSYMTYDEANNWAQKHALAAFYQKVTAEKEAVEEPEVFSWASTFTVKAGSIEKYNETFNYPEEFEMEVQYYEEWGIYLVTKFFGNDVTALNSGGIGFSVSADDPNKAEMTTGRYLQTIEAGVSYLCLKDMNLTDSPLTLTRNEDGTITISNFCISHMTYDEANNWAQSHAAAALYKDVTIEEPAVEEPEVFSWASTFTVKAGSIEKYNETFSYPEEFEMEVQYYEEWGIYLVTKFFGNDVTALNNGGIGFSVSADDPNKAEMTTGRYLQTIEAGVSYLCLKDMNLTDSPLTLTRNEDGTITISNFCISHMTYDEANNWAQSHVAAALYKDVTIAEFTKPEPVITLTAEVVEGTERTFEFASAVAGTVISIDWGNGEIVVADTLEEFDGWNQSEVKGIPVGKGEIKIYATGDLCYFHCVSNVNGPGITKLDVSKATELTELYANGNKLTSVDVSMLSKLETLYLNNNSLTEVKDLPASLTYLQLANNKLTSFDGSKLTAVTTLYLSDNNLGTLDVSDMSALKSLYALNCGLTSFTAGALTTPKAFINVNNNLLETLDLSEATGLGEGTLFAMGNNLTEVKFPDVEIKSANISKNKFTLATIPATAKVKTLTYAPQQDMVIEDIKETIDLSAQNNLVGLSAEAQATVYTWLTEAGDTLVAGVDYTEEAGKFTFIKEQAQKVYCTMSTAAFPKFTGANIFKTVAVAVTAAATGIDSMEASVELTGDIYAVDGKLIKSNASVADMPKGLYIVKTAAGKAIKVIRK